MYDMVKPQPFSHSLIYHLSKFILLKSVSHTDYKNYDLKTDPYHQCSNFGVGISEGCFIFDLASLLVTQPF